MHQVLSGSRYAKWEGKVGKGNDCFCAKHTKGMWDKSEKHCKELEQLQEEEVCGAQEAWV